jgi:hypothetical protein
MVKNATTRTIPPSWPADNDTWGAGLSRRLFCPRWLLHTLSFPGLRPTSRLQSFSSCLVLLLARWQQDSGSSALYEAPHAATEVTMLLINRRVE